MNTDKERYLRNLGLAILSQLWSVCKRINGSSLSQINVQFFT